MSRPALPPAAYWIAFSHVPEIGARRATMLREAFGSMEAAWWASESDLREAGLGTLALKNLLVTRSKLDPGKTLDKVTDLGAWVVSPEDADYPALLRRLDDSPLILYGRGTLLPTDDRALAIVGTRRATPYGLDATTLLSRGLVRQGVTIVSGLAHGIDAAAHRTALETGGRTITVLGCGIDDVYPRDHRALADQIASRGAVITEFPPGAKPERHHFPRRNRIISGISLGVLIPEAPEGSGALITATYAAEQGRDVFAVPGSIFHASSGGANRLIQDGAKLVLTVEDILDELNLTYEIEQTQATTVELAPADPTEAQILALLGRDPLHMDEIIRRSGLPTAVVSSTCALLELKGLARNAGHMQYSLPL